LPVTFLFGRYDFRSNLSVPAQNAEIARRAKSFSEAKLICASMWNPDEIDRMVDPPENFQGTGGIGAFGIKVPKEIWRTRFVAVQYGRAAVLLGVGMETSPRLVPHINRSESRNRCSCWHRRAETKVSAPRRGRRISAVCIDGNTRWSDPATMSLRAEPSPDGSEFVLNGEKPFGSPTV